MNESSLASKRCRKIKLPRIPAGIDPPLRKMSLVEYALFSESCLQANSTITSGNCMVKRADEKTMTPFRMPPRF